MAGEMKGRKVAVLATDGVEQVELEQPMQALRDAGAEVHLIALERGEIQGLNHMDKGDRFPVDRTLADANPNDYAGLAGIDVVLIGSLAAHAPSCAVVWSSSEPASCVTKCAANGHAASRRRPCARPTPSPTLGPPMIDVLLTDITTLDVDAVVNAANSELRGGGGVDGAIHRAAGPGLMRELRRHGDCATGSAVLTTGHALPARYVIHAVGPIWAGGGEDEPALLA